MEKSNLTEGDHENLDAFLGFVLDDYKAGRISKFDAISGLTHVIAAIDDGNHEEARRWFQQGRKFTRVPCIDAADQAKDAGPILASSPFKKIGK